MQGGQRVEYSRHSDWHLKWKRLNVQPMDCGANCFSLLGYSNLYTSNEIARRTMKGLYLSDITDMLDDAYGPGHEWIWTHSLNELNGYLPIGQATLAYVQHVNANLGGHYFVIVRETDYYFAIDAQVNRIMLLQEYLSHLLSEGFLNAVRICHSPKVLQGNNRVTMRIVNRHLPLLNPRKTRRYRPTITQSNWM